MTDSTRINENTHCSKKASADGKTHRSIWSGSRLQSTFCFVKKYVIDIAMITTTPSDSNNVIYHAFPFMYTIDEEAVSRQRMIDVMMQKI